MATATRTAKASIFLMSEKKNNNDDNNFARAAQFFCTFLGRCISRLQRKAIIKLPSLYNSRFLRINRHM